jgi:hypothetical protein
MFVTRTQERAVTSVLSVLRHPRRLKCASPAQQFVMHIVSIAEGSLALAAPIFSLW